MKKQRVTAVLSNIEQFKMLSKTHMRNKDVREFFGCCRTKAWEIIDVIKGKIKQNGETPYTDCISTKAFMDYYGINLKEVFDLAKKEIELKRLLSAC